MSARELPHCFGLGRDPDSRQRVPMFTCRNCDARRECMQTRQAMGTEAIVEILREWLDVHAPFKGRRGEPR